MAKELTPPAILRQFHQTGTVPESMLPLEGFQATPEDPTKPLRGAFEGILLARAAPVALSLVSQEFARQRGSQYYEWHMTPLAEIEEEEGIDVRFELLKRKELYVLDRYLISLGQVLRHELDESSRKNLPPSVAFAYGKLTEEDTSEGQAEGIMSASETLTKATTELFRIAGYDYSKVLRRDPSARQMVDLVANSYQSYIHPQTGMHIEVDVAVEEDGVLGETYTIDLSGDLHKVVIVNPSQYHQKEKEMRKVGKIKDQKIHCPFAMNSRFTAPFLDETTDPSDTNPLQHTYETLVKGYIGS